MRELTLQSGAVLRIQPAPFRAAKRLFDALALEIKDAKMDPKEEIDVNFIKGILLGAVASPKVEEALWPCLVNCIYNDHKITTETFENSDARVDFLEICYEVGKENVFPFMKNLYSKYSPILQGLGLNLK